MQGECVPLPLLLLSFDPKVKVTGNGAARSFWVHMRGLLDRPPERQWRRGGLGFATALTSFRRALRASAAGLCVAGLGFAAREGLAPSMSIRLC